MKRTMHNPEYFEGKIISPSKWDIPDGWETCAITGKFYRFDDLDITFPHYRFDKQVLLDNGIYCEDADWLSEEGYDIIISTLDRLGILDQIYAN